MAQMPVRIDGVEYPSITIASQRLGVSTGYISSRLNDPGNTEFERIKQQPKPGRPKSREGETSVVIRCTHGQKEAFLAACEMLQTSPEQFITSAMKTAALNAVHVIRENLIEVQGYDADDFEKGILKSWTPRNVGPDVIPADLFE